MSGWLTSGLMIQGWRGDATALLERALEGYERLLGEMPSVNGSAIAPEKYLRGRATCSLYIAKCIDATGVGTDVLARYERAIADFEELTRRLPADVDLWVDLARVAIARCVNSL